MPTGNCFTKGHRDCCSGDCCMHGKSKVERDAAVAFIVKESIEITVEKNASRGKHDFAKRNLLFTFS